MKSSAKKVELASVDDLFTTEQERQQAGEERVVRIPLSQLHYFKGYPAMQTEVPFAGQPYRVKDDDPKMLETLDIQRLQKIYGEDYSPVFMERSARDVAWLLHEAEERNKIRKRMRERERKAVPQREW